MKIGITVTGLKELNARFNEAPDIIEHEVAQALADSIAMVETESKRRTPVKTGLLRSSIGGEEGFSFVRGLTAGVGTNVKYAIHVHEGHGKHVTGERKFMEKGAEASELFISRVFDKAIKNVSEALAK